MNNAAIEPYAAIGVTLLIVLVIAGAILIIAHTVGPSRHGPVKDSPYESGMPLAADNDHRLHVRFYVVAMLFLLFDVEVVFMWPWAGVFHAAAVDGATIPMRDGGVAGKTFLLAGFGVFFALLLFGLLYEWKKGAFEWD